VQAEGEFSGLSCDVAAVSENGEQGFAARLTTALVNGALSPTSLDANACYRALTARDARFDGAFFVGVTTTGIYCRPICPARTPGKARCEFFRSAALAEQRGFRACFRCRPELAPGGASVDAPSAIVSAAVARIDAGALSDGSLDDLARDLGVSSRHLRRAMQAELGVSPVELAQSRRLALAKQLLHDTSLSMTEVALASGFASLRRFNASFRARFDRAPSALRKQAGALAPVEGTFPVVLGHRPPLDWASLLGFLRARATPGVEAVDERTYRRTIQIGKHRGWVSVAPHEKRAALRADVSVSLAPVLMPVTRRLRDLFDLDARPSAVTSHLAADPTLGPLVARRPGLRVPGAFDGFEIGVRAVLGQQVSVAAATTLAGRLAAKFGHPVATPHASLTTAFPTAARLAGLRPSDIASIGLTAARAAGLSALARAVHAGEVKLDGSGPVEAVTAALERLPGIGPWTAAYVAMRALGSPDAFPGGDLALRRALGDASTKEAYARSEGWRPWRAYAAMHLWTSLAGDTT
jgi:AraC family transcriptional regulator of adaptative response / DNA-3-methyladenine glycosylase II